MSRKKKVLYISNGVLLVWFTLAMIGLKIGDQTLVTKAWEDDYVLYLIYAVAVLSFILIEKVGKYILSSWLFLWLSTQFYFHWWITITGPWSGKINYFKGTIKLIPTEKIYIPDLYHIILHIMVLWALLSTINYIISSKKLSPKLQ